MIAITAIGCGQFLVVSYVYAGNHYCVNEMMGVVYAAFPGIFFLDAPCFAEVGGGCALYGIDTLENRLQEQS